MPSCPLPTAPLRPSPLQLPSLQGLPNHRPTLIVMTTHDYDLDANFFSYYFPVTTPPSLHVLLPGLVPLLSFPLYFYHSLAYAAWPMIHSDDSGCATSLFS